MVAVNKEDEPRIVKESSFNDLGIKLSLLTDDIRMNQNIPSDVNGLFVIEVNQNSDAERKGIRPGDIIQEVNQTPVNGFNELKKIINKSKKRNKGALLMINRQGNIVFTAVRLN